ncbi:MAG TPA: Tol-Pal system beta propeller repeat protein TolB [Caulobacterales bacterium]|nr:Tol-Pal system beta propeller repeat protein TolB [Caulobacterales bacterium]
MTALRRLAALILGCLAFCMAPGAAHAALQVDITKGNLDPMPIATADFTGANDQPAQVGADIARVVRADLDRSGLFKSIDPAAFIERNPNATAQPRFADWKIINAQALVVGRTTNLPDGRLQAEFRLWDVTTEAYVMGREYKTTPENWRRLAHKVADAIYEQLTGEKGYFDTRIVFVSESGPKTRRVKRLAIMDQDGANPTFLTSGDYQVLTPRFSPTTQQITYMSFETGKPRVFLFNIETGRQETISGFSGMTFAPRFTPDGAAVLLTQENGGNSEIYRMDLRSRAMSKLTNDPGIDTSPSGAPDGSQIVFNSDRGGSPQLYVMGADGGGVHRISFGDGRYMTPVWSPRGDLIAFTKQMGGEFAIGVMRPDGSGERILAKSYLDEGPTWSPNGRVIMFFRQPRPGAAPSIWSVDLTGQNLRQIQTPGDASDPAWSPLLP